MDSPRPLPFGPVRSARIRQMRASFFGEIPEYPEILRFLATGGKMAKAAVLLAVLLPGLSGCTAQEWERALAGPPPVPVFIPTDPEPSCYQIDKARSQALLAFFKEWSRAGGGFSNTHLNRLRALRFQSKALRSLYKRRGCAELQALQYCLDIDRASRAGTGYSLKEYIRQYGIMPKLAAEGEQVDAAIAACLEGVRHFWDSGL